MLEKDWESNPNWRELNPPAEGDLVKLKHVSAFSHNVKVIVTSTDGNDITGLVEAVFDWETNSIVRGGEIYNLVGKELSFKRPLIHKVIKKA